MLANNPTRFFYEGWAASGWAIGSTPWAASMSRAAFVWRDLAALIRRKLATED
jgi:hypothetical protein